MNEGFIAKYSGSKCYLCGLAIHKGYDRITSVRGLHAMYRHVEDCDVAHAKSEVRRFLDAGRTIAEVCDLYYAAIAKGLAWDTANAAMNYAAEYAAVRHAA
jgi:hypothetical protein